jgi:hypothetical protein
VPPASGAFSPLDEELELGSETFDPWLVESIVLLGTVAPFERVPLVMGRLLRAWKAACGSATSRQRKSR